MESVISGIVDYTISKIDKYIVTPVASEVTYVCFINSNFEKLMIEVEMLKETRECVQNMVSNARRNADDIKPVVEKWLSEVDDIISKYEEMVLVNEGRHGRSCSNLVQRHKLSKRARKMVDEVILLKGKGSFDQVSSPGLLINQSSPQKIVGFLDFESRVLIMNQIVDALQENHVNRIGVYGMGGVGKTMFVKEILRKIKEKKSFDEVVISTISQIPDLKLIQGQLADMLGLKFEQETIEGRALKLWKRLMNEKKILIVFDDIWEYIDLETIGIPSVEDHIGCKILFTSREKHLLSNELCTNKTFEIKVLEKHEAWNLFETIIGEIVENRKPIAHQIVKECAHLPIAITTVAKALRNKPFSIWEDALDQLKKPLAMNIKGMEKNVYSSLKLSYDYLECEEVKLLFLLCSMFPEDFPIYVEDLQVYAMSMGFLLGVDTIAQGRKRITKLVDDLISSSLLLQHEFRVNYVKMHDLLRDVAILISSKHDRIRTLSYVKEGSEKWEEEKLSGNYTVAYVKINDLHYTLIHKILIPKVQLLTLRTSGFDKYELVESFFKDMKDLKSLELNGAKIPILPSSLHLFANVRLLHLLHCELGNIDMIGEFKKLEILSFKGSSICQIPSTISQLTELKVLDLSDCKQLNVIPPNILSKLTKLEELYLECFNGWEREEWYEGRKNASLSELWYLPHLYALNLNIQDEKILPKQFFSREMNLRKFIISIGILHSLYTWSVPTKFLYLNVESACCLDDSINTLLKRSEKLYLKGSISTKDLQLKLHGSSHLKELTVGENLEIKHLIHEETKPLRKILSNLESLDLENMENLESIVHGYDKEPAFHKLRRVMVQNCNELKNLFFNCILNDMLNLEEIRISCCKKVEELFVTEDEESTNQIEFTHLKSLQLWGGFLQLQKFCSKIEKPETSTICNGDSFFSKLVSLPNLEELIMRGAENLKMIWPNMLIPNSFSKLKEVHICSCQSLEKVFPSKMMSILSNLHTLHVEDCNLLQGIFEVQDVNSTESSLVVIRNLRNLELSNLPNLEFVWSKDACELHIFEDIRDISIIKCPKLKKAFQVDQVIVKQLKSLHIDLGELKEILEKAKTMQMQDGSRWFSNLKSLTLCGNLDYKLTQLPMEVVQILHNLIDFEVKSTFIEEIFAIATEGLINVEQYQNATSLALERLCLSKMPKLTHIWKESSHNNILSLQNLHFLEVSRCSQLHTLLPSSLAFKNLSYLIVDECHRFTHLLDPSHIRAMVQLNYLDLSSCKEMITVIAGGDEEENYEIVFNNLTSLHLMQFSKLANFYSGKCIIGFPCLEDVEVSNCPEMKVFSQGIVATPALPTKSIHFNSSFSWPPKLKVNSEEFFVNDMNTIFRQLWEDNHDAASIQRLFAEENSEEIQCDLYP